MRFILVAVIWIVMIGGVSMYSSRREGQNVQTAFSANLTVAAEKKFTVIATPTFSTEKDPFSLDPDSGDGSAFEIRLNGQLLDPTSDKVNRGEQLRWETVEGIIVGQNEIFIKASPPISESHLDHGIRIQVQEDGVAMVDQTIWGAQGSLVSGTINFKIEHSVEDGHEHG